MTWAGSKHLFDNRYEARALVEEFTLQDGRRLYLLADGRLVNLGWESRSTG